jgi:hypothetical protein
MEGEAREGRSLSETPTWAGSACSVRRKPPPVAPLSLLLASVLVVPVPPITLFLSLKLLDGVGILLNML